MSRQYKKLATGALLTSLISLTGCIVTPNADQGYNSYNNAQNQSQHLNSYKASTSSGEWDRGCADAKVGSYDRSGHAGSGYEEGWQACKNNSQHNTQQTHDREWNRGCDDAKSGSYDRSGNAGPNYEDGWQSCNNQHKSDNVSGTVEDAKRICLEKMSNNPRIQTISALKPGFWEIIMQDTSGRKVACTADTAAGNVADWVEM